MASVAEALSIALDHHGAGRVVEAETLYRRILAAVPDEANARHLLGVLCGQTGRGGPALRLLREAVALAPAMADHHRNLAALLDATGCGADTLPALRAAHRLIPAHADTADRLARALVAAADRALDGGTPAVAARLYREALALRPESTELRFNLAVADRDSGHTADAAAGFADAARRQPELAAAHLEQGLALNRLGRPAEAARALRRALATVPGHADALYALGTVTTDAAPLRRAIAGTPDHAHAHAALALLHQRAGRTAEAAAGHRRALALAPALPEALVNLGTAFGELARLDASLQLAQRAVALDPANADHHLALGNALQARRLFGAAQAAYRAALARRPAFPEAYGNLGMAQLRAGRPTDALRSLAAAAVLRPDDRTQYANLGLTLKDIGRVSEALTAYRRALAVDPGWTETHSDLIFTMDFDSTATTADLQAERRRFNERHAVPLRAVRRPLRNDPDPERRLRVGHVSADFRVNSAAFAFGPVLRLLDRSRFEVVCYSGVTVEDAMTREFRMMATLWRDTAGLGDEALAERIRADGIDVLVDMSGHSSGNRLAVFARRPAPVQLSGWTHPHGIGLETMDAVFSDTVTIPAAERHLFMEQVWDLPCCIGFEAPSYAPPVVAPPSQASGRITFGCLNRLSKVTPPVIALWARLLRACPGTALLLKDKALGDPAERERLHSAFAAHGVDPERLRLLGGSAHADHLAAYGQVDIALDPFPLGGGITTMESLWMGVPVVTLLDRKPPGRVAGAIEASLGMGDWVATDEDAYIAIATAKAADPAALAPLRAGLRRHFAASPVGDFAQYTRAVEDAYRNLWRRWCRASTKL
ncbi:tetratricopeptide repeat protein [Azospirillum sp. RWY-5-1]|uniref:protein O-GlcNAc transferase n=1 Tax=Azospirillum oleiclasticum TaxID=2735135 RepID=A0ABX2T5J5_9PROT|nr:tetratricopeptide repeat protein [Azospirillum oleiclasticum]NYZ12319.1 tetratricopeptide repeat protein [Azospirillum oleiclasticum]NYZ19479.1 tetratricopeptide repeat protein [Azospirillum oleiclasticum]